MTGLRIFQLARALKPAADAAGATLLVNDRLDVALSLGLHGVHLGQRSLPTDVARDLLGKDRLLGVSVHSFPEAKEGTNGGADFLIVGALFPTDSHPDLDPVGVGLLGELEPLAPPPLVGIGGISAGKVMEVMRRGAQGVAVRGGIWGAPNPVEALNDYLCEVRRGGLGSDRSQGVVGQKKSLGVDHG